MLLRHVVNVPLLEALLIKFLELRPLDYITRLLRAIQVPVLITTRLHLSAILCRRRALVLPVPKRDRAQKRHTRTLLPFSTALHLILTTLSIRSLLLKSLMSFLVVSHVRITLDYLLKRIHP